MARKKTPKLRVNVKAMISSRLREIRQEQFGEHGGPELARRLDLPARTWYNYETGVTVPAEVLLSFIDQTGTNPLWLLNGEGPKYRRGMEDQVLAEPDARAVDPARPGEARAAAQRRRWSSRRRTCRPRASRSSWRSAWSPWPSCAGPPARPNGRRATSWPTASGCPTPRRRSASGSRTTRCTRSCPGVRSSPSTGPSPTRARCKARSSPPAPTAGRSSAGSRSAARHFILRPNQQTSENPMIAIEQAEKDGSPIVGQVVWSWSRFSDA